VSYSFGLELLTGRAQLFRRNNFHEELAQRCDLLLRDLKAYRRAHATGFVANLVAAWDTSLSLDQKLWNDGLYTDDAFRARVDNMTERFRYYQLDGPGPAKARSKEAPVRILRGIRT